MKKKFVFLLLAFILLCSTATVVWSWGKKKKIQIVTVVKLVGIPWFDRLEEGVKEASKKLKIDGYMTGPANNDEAEQVKIVEDIVNKGVDAICVVPLDAKALEPVFEKAKKKGIKIITHESANQKNHDYDIELIDDKTFGEWHATKFIELLGKKSGKYAIFVGSLTVPGHNAWADAAIAKMKRDYPGMKLVTDRVPCAEDPELSKQKTLELLQAYPDLDGIIGFGSQGPIGAAMAVEEKGLIGKFVTIGTVLPGQALPFLKRKSLSFGTLWDPKAAGFAMSYIAKMLIENKAVEVGTEVPLCGKIAQIDGKTILFDSPMSITAKNAASFGF